jgi:hypothetical protein
MQVHGHILKLIQAFYVCIHVSAWLQHLRHVEIVIRTGIHAQNSTTDSKTAVFCTTYLTRIRGPINRAENSDRKFGGWHTTWFSVFSCVKCMFYMVFGVCSGLATTAVGPDVIHQFSHDFSLFKTHGHRGSFMVDATHFISILGFFFCQNCWDSNFCRSQNFCSKFLAFFLLLSSNFRSFELYQTSSYSLLMLAA